MFKIKKKKIQGSILEFLNDSSDVRVLDWNMKLKSHIQQESTQSLVIFPTGLLKRL